MVFIEPVKLRFHKPHIFLSGDLAIFVGIHKKQQLLEVVLRDYHYVLRLWN